MHTIPSYPSVGDEIRVPCVEIRNLDNQTEVVKLLKESFGIIASPSSTTTIGRVVLKGRQPLTRSIQFEGTLLVYGDLDVGETLSIPTAATLKALQTPGICFDDDEAQQALNNSTAFYRGPYRPPHSSHHPSQQHHGYPPHSSQEESGRPYPSKHHDASPHSSHHKPYRGDPRHSPYSDYYTPESKNEDPSTEVNKCPTTDLMPGLAVFNATLTVGSRHEDFYLHTGVIANGADKHSHQCDSLRPYHHFDDHKKKGATPSHPHRPPPHTRHLRDTVDSSRLDHVRQGAGVVFNPVHEPRLADKLAAAENGGEHSTQSSSAALSLLMSKIPQATLEVHTEQCEVNPKEYGRLIVLNFSTNMRNARVLVYGDYIRYQPNADLSHNLYAPSDIINTDIVVLCGTVKESLCNCSPKFFPVVNTDVNNHSGYRSASIGDKCYFTLFDPSHYLSFYEARRFCQLSGGDLATITNGYENQLLTELTLNAYGLGGNVGQPVWIGGVRVSPSGFEWVGDKKPGTSQFPAVGKSPTRHYSNWAGGNSHIEDNWVTLDPHRGSWISQPDSSIALPFICQGPTYGESVELPFGADYVLGEASEGRRCESLWEPSPNGITSMDFVYYSQSSVAVLGAEVSRLSHIATSASNWYFANNLFVRSFNKYFKQPQNTLRVDGNLYAAGIGSGVGYHIHGHTKTNEAVITLHSRFHGDLRVYNMLETSSAQIDIEGDLIIDAYQLALQYLEVNGDPDIINGDATYTYLKCGTKMEIQGDFRFGAGQTVGLPVRTLAKGSRDKGVVGELRRGVFIHGAHVNIIGSEGFVGESSDNDEYMFPISIESEAKVTIAKGDFVWVYDLIIADDSVLNVLRGDVVLGGYLMLSSDKALQYGGQLLISDRLPGTKLLIGVVPTNYEKIVEAPCSIKPFGPHIKRKVLQGGRVVLVEAGREYFPKGLNIPGVDLWVGGRSCVIVTGTVRVSSLHSENGGQMKVFGGDLIASEEIIVKEGSLVVVGNIIAPSVTAARNGLVIATGDIRTPIKTTNLNGIIHDQAPHPHLYETYKTFFESNHCLAFFGAVQVPYLPPTSLTGVKCTE
eukprot:GHVN01068926.1.p1 GENE.GHVN01068926.1~~GHVN01068926.1.p1  ORF type:complete len:1078 (+),score=174.71 GHVN01068926.1:474-3707(+)